MRTLTVFNKRGKRLSALQLPDPLHNLIPGIMAEKLFGGLADQLAFPLRANQFNGGLIDERDPIVGPDNHDGVRAVFDQPPVTFLVAMQFGFGLFARRDVARDLSETAQLPPFVLQCRENDVGLKSLSAPVQATAFLLKSALAGGGFQNRLRPHARQVLLGEKD